MDPILRVLPSKLCGVYVLHAPPQTGKPSAARAAIQELQRSGKISGCLDSDVRTFSPTTKYTVTSHANSVLSIPSSLEDTVHGLVSLDPEVSASKPVIVLLDHWDEVLTRPRKRQWEDMITTLAAAEQSMDYRTYKVLLLANGTSFSSQDILHLNGGKKIQDILH